MPYPTPQTGKTIPEFTAGTVDGNSLFYESKNNQGYKVSGDDIANYTAGSKLYTALNTTSKNLVGAMNELKADISNLPSPMIFKGTLGTGGTIQTLPAAAASNEGWTYKVIEDGTYSGTAAKVGDVFTSDGSAWVLIPAGDDVEDTWRAVQVDGVEILGNAISSGPLNLIGGNNVTLSNVLGEVTIDATVPEDADEISYDNTASGLTATDVQDAIDEVAGKVLTGTLTAGSTTLTISDPAITADSFIQLWCNPLIWANSIVASVGSVVMTFDAQPSDVNVYVKVT